MTQIIQMVGQRFGRLLVVEMVAERRNEQACWRCRCDCGKEVIKRGRELRVGRTISCGCYLNEIRSIGTRLKHGGCGTPEHKAWLNIRQRCYDPKHISYKYYGPYGVTVAPEWLNDFAAFRDYIGPRPSPKHSVDRINPWGNYEPGNVRWATQSEQAKNQRPRRPNQKRNRKPKA